MGRKRGCFISLILVVAIVIGAGIAAFYFFNKDRAYNYFPKNYQLIARIDDHRSFMKLYVPYIQKDEKLKTILTSPVLKYLPAPRVYVVIDKKGEHYIFAELSFAARFLASYGKVKGNVFCFTSNKNFELTTTDTVASNEELKTFVTKTPDGDASFYYPVPESDQFPFLNGKALQGVVNARSGANALQVKLNLPYEYKTHVGFGDAKAFDKFVPDRLDMYVMFTMKDFEVHYAALRKLVFNTDAFQGFYKTKLKIFDKTGIDLENHLLPMVSERFFVGVYQKNSYFCLGSGDVEKRMTDVENTLKASFPVDFEEKEYNGTKYKTIVLTGLLGFIARGVAGDELESMKKPFYYIDKNVFFLFDSLQGLKNYTDRDMKFNLRNDKDHSKLADLLPNDRHITVYYSERLLADQIKKPEVSENIGDILGAFSFTEKALEGTVVIHIKEQ